MFILLHYLEHETFSRLAVTMVRDIFFREEIMSFVSLLSP